MKILIVFLLVFSTGTILSANDKLQKLDTTLYLSNDIKEKLALSFGVKFVHFFPTEEAKEKNWRTNPLDLGGELLLSYNIANRLNLLTGFNYQRGKISLDHQYYGDQTTFHEMSFPFLIELDEIGFKIKSGFYLGKFIDINRKTKGAKNSTYTNKWTDYHLDANSRTFICDFYLGIQNKSLNLRTPIGLELFCRYKLNDSWLNKDISRFMCGLKVNYQIKLL